MVSERTCTACRTPVAPSRLSRVVIGGHAVDLCRTHAARVAVEMPTTYAELRALFPETHTDESPHQRRSVLDRRRSDDRRVFPPRPEGRRREGGRRADDNST